ncbi:MAG TPA: hypothetical protein VG406_13815 [Isosphaeraceae bacterium]|jgi:hypothetical protein|nr:hypothetical protein [Isosphaeraceae bacterium]
MPLRDHFRPPLSDRRRWDGVFVGWPAMMVIGLNRRLSQRYVAEPRIHPGSSISDPDAFEVRVLDARNDHRLVAAVELVSPSNEDRPEHRRAFVAKCVAMLQDQVCVAIVDILTTCPLNFYQELRIQSEPTDSPAIYAVSCRHARRGDGGRFDAWSHPLTVGQPLPTLPLWLADNIAVPLELEASYEETCRILRLP